MKKYIILLLILCSYFSCKDEPKKSKLEGTYRMSVNSNETGFAKVFVGFINYTNLFYVTFDGQENCELNVYGSFTVINGIIKVLSDKDLRDDFANKYFVKGDSLGMQSLSDHKMIFGKINNIENDYDSFVYFDRKGDCQFNKVFWSE